MATLRDKDKEAALDARIRRIHEENRIREERRLEVERDRLSWRASGSDQARISQYVRVTAAAAPKQRSSSGSSSQQSPEASDESMVSDDDVAPKSATEELDAAAIKTTVEESDDIATNKLTAEGSAAGINGGDSGVLVTDTMDRRCQLSRSHGDGGESFDQLPPSEPDSFRHQPSVADVQLNYQAKCTAVQTESQISSRVDSQPNIRQICSQVDHRVPSLESDHSLTYRPAGEVCGVHGAERFPDVAAWPGQDVVVAPGVEQQEEARPGSVSPISALLMSAGTGDIYRHDSTGVSSVGVDSIGGDHSLRRPTSPSQSGFEPRPVPAYPAEAQHPAGQSHVAQLAPTASMAHAGADLCSDAMLPYTQRSPYPPVSHPQHNLAASGTHSWTHDPPDVTDSSLLHQASTASDLYQRRIDRPPSGFNPTSSEFRIEGASLGSGFQTGRQSRYVQPVPQSPEVDNSVFYGVSRSRQDSTGDAGDVMSRFQHDFPTPPRNTRHPGLVSATTDSRRTSTHLHRSLPADALLHPQHTLRHAQNPENENVLQLPRRPPNVTLHDTSVQNAPAYSSDNFISHHSANFSEATSNSVLNPNVMDQNFLRPIDGPHQPGAPNHTSDATNGDNPYSTDGMHQPRNPLNFSYRQHEQKVNIPGLSRGSQFLAARHPSQSSGASQRWQHLHYASERDLINPSDTSHLQLRSDTAYHPQHPSNNPQHHFNPHLFPGNDPRVHHHQLNDQQYPLSDPCHLQRPSINHPHPVNVPGYTQLSSNNPQHPHHLNLQPPGNSPRIQELYLKDQQHPPSDPDHTRLSSNNHQQPQQHINLQQYPGNNPRSQQHLSHDSQHSLTDHHSQRHISNDPQHHGNYPRNQQLLPNDSSNQQFPSNEPCNQQILSNDPKHHGIDQKYSPNGFQHPPNGLNHRKSSSNDPCHSQHNNNSQRSQNPSNSPNQPSSSSDHSLHLQHAFDGTLNSSHLPPNHSYASYDSQDAAHVSQHPKLSGSPLNHSGDQEHPSCASSSAHSLLNPTSDSAEPDNGSSIAPTSSVVNPSVSPPASDSASSRCAESAACVSARYSAGGGCGGSQTRRPRLPHRFQDGVALDECSPLRGTDSNSPGILGLSQPTAAVEMYESNQNGQGQDAGCDINSDLGGVSVVNNARVDSDDCREESSGYVCENLSIGHCSVSGDSRACEEGNLNRNGRYVAADGGHQCDDPIQAEPAVLDGSALLSLNDGRLQTGNFNSDVSTLSRAKPAGIPMTPLSASESIVVRPRACALLGMSDEPTANRNTSSECAPIDNFEQLKSQCAGESVASLLPRSIDETASVLPVLPVSGFPTPPTSPRHRLGSCAQDAINPGSEEGRDCEVEVVEEARVSMGNEKHIAVVLNRVAPVERLRRPLRSHSRTIDTGSVAAAMGVSSLSSSQPSNDDGSGSPASSTTSGRRPTLTPTGVDLSVPPPGYHPLSTIVLPRSDGPKEAVEDFQREPIVVSVDVSRPPPVVNTTRESSGHPIDATREPSGRLLSVSRDSSVHPANVTHERLVLHSNLSIEPIESSSAFSTYSETSGVPVSSASEVSVPTSVFSATADPCGLPMWRTATGVSKPPRALVARRQEPPSDDTFSRADRDMDWRCSHARPPPASVRRAPDPAPSIPAVGANFQCVTFVDGQVVHSYDQSLLKVADIRLRDSPRQ